MAISFVAADTDATVNGSTISFALGAGFLAAIQPDDLMILVASDPTLSDVNMEAAITNSTFSVGGFGWTPISDLYFNDTNDVNVGLWMKFYDGVEAEPNILMSFGGTDGCSAVIMAFRGVDRTRPLDVVPTTAVLGNTGLANPPSITPSGASGVWTVIAGGIGGGASGETWTGPTGYTTNFTFIQSGDSNPTASFIGYKSSPSSPEDPGALSFSAADSTNWSYGVTTLALRPSETTGIQYVGSTKDETSNGGDVTLDLTSISMEEGDLVVVAYVSAELSDVDMTITAPGSAYTEVADLYVNDTDDMNLGVFYKFMGASPDSVVTADGHASASAGVAAIAMVFRNVDTSSPLDVAATTATSINTDIPDPPSNNYSDTEALILAIGGTSGGSADPGNCPKNYIGDSITGDDTERNTVTMSYCPAYLAGDPADPGPMYRGDSNRATAVTTSGMGAVTMALRLLVESGQLHINVSVVGV